MPESHSIGFIMVSSSVKQGIKIEQITFEKYIPHLADETGQRWYSPDYRACHTLRLNNKSDFGFKSDQGPSERLMRGEWGLGTALHVV